MTGTGGGRTLETGKIAGYVPKGVIMEHEMLNSGIRKQKACRRCWGWTLAAVVATWWTGGWAQEMDRGASGLNDLDQPVPLWRLPDAATVQNGVIAGFPDVPMQIQATIKTRQQGGPIDKVVNAEVLLNTEAGLYSAMYTITDAFGGSPEQLIVEREPDRAPRYRFRVGEPLHDAQIPNLFQQVKETDLTWLDLGLSYLWWPNGETIGTDRLRGRFCYIVEIPAPHDYAGDFEYVRLWIDPKINMLLQAEAYNVLGDKIRRMSIDSFKKIDGVWFIKDIDLYTYPERNRTTRCACRACARWSANWKKT